MTGLIKIIDSPYSTLSLSSWVFLRVWCGGEDPEDPFVVLGEWGGEEEEAVC